MTTKTTKHNVDVLIVGAGQAGMAAAYRLLTAKTTTDGAAAEEEAANNNNRPFSFHVVEAHAHVGGRTRNVNADQQQQYDIATDDVVELGGTWISPNHTAFLNLCRELNIDVFRASFLAAVETAASASGVESNSNAECNYDTLPEEEWPWWYWGPEYSKEEIRNALKTIFHQCLISGTTTDCKHSKFCFSNPNELMSQLDERVRRDLKTVGNIIENTSAQMADLSWDATKPGPRWSEVDGFTTSSRLMPSLDTNGGRNVLRHVIHNKNAQEPEQVSFLYNMLSFKGCNSSGPDNEFRVRGGTQAVPLAIASKLGDGHLTLGDAIQRLRRIVSLSDERQPGRLEATTRNGKVFSCKAVILTGSPAAIMGIDFEPPLPAVQAQLLQRMPMGSSRKVIAIYKQGPWWRNFGYSGDILASGLPKELSLSVALDGNDEREERVPIFGQCYDTSPFSQKYGALTCFIEGRQNLYFSNLTEEEQRDLLHQFLRLTFHDLEKECNEVDEELWKPDLYTTYNWSDDPYSRGAYTAFFPPGVLSIPEWWDAYGNMEKAPNVFLAGADYHTGFGNGFIEGAVRSGQLAADMVLQSTN